MEPRGNKTEKNNWEAFARRESGSQTICALCRQRRGRTAKTDRCDLFDDTADEAIRRAKICLSC